MSEQTLSQLQGMVDRLGPGMWLVLDEAAVERYFGRSFRDAFGIARAFAEMNNCTFQREGGKRAIRLGRAYYRAASLRRPPQESAA
jgi:hypothetical protein